MEMKEQITEIDMTDLDESQKTNPAKKPKAQNLSDQENSTDKINLEANRIKIEKDGSYESYD